MEWGQPILAEALDEKLATGDYDAVTLIHNETSTGVMSPLAEIAAVMRRYPDVISIVDSVSSFSAVPIPMDELGLDVLLTGSQKALALPPGLAVFSRFAKGVRARRAEQGPWLLLRFPGVQEEPGRRHDARARRASGTSTHCSRSWRIFSPKGLPRGTPATRGPTRSCTNGCEAKDFGFFAPEGYRSKTLTCVSNNRDIDVAAWIGRVKKKHHFVFDGGYGKLKGKTFRISNMGDETEETVGQLLAALSECLDG